MKKQLLKCSAIASLFILGMETTLSTMTTLADTIQIDENNQSIGGPLAEQYTHEGKALRLSMTDLVVQEYTCSFFHSEWSSTGRRFKITADTPFYLRGGVLIHGLKYTSVETGALKENKSTKFLIPSQQCSELFQQNSVIEIDKDMERAAREFSEAQVWEQEFRLILQRDQEKTDAFYEGKYYTSFYDSAKRRFEFVEKQYQSLNSTIFEEDIQRKLEECQEKIQECENRNRSLSEYYRMITHKDNFAPRSQEISREEKEELTSFIDKAGDYLSIAEENEAHGKIVLAIQNYQQALYFYRQMNKCQYDSRLQEFAFYAQEGIQACEKKIQQLHADPIEIETSSEDKETLEVLKTSSRKNLVPPENPNTHDPNGELSLPNKIINYWSNINPKYKSFFDHPDMRVDHLEPSPLFGEKNQIQLSDIQQGNQGDCYFLSALASVIAVNPQLIRDLIQDLGNGWVVIQFFEESRIRPIYIAIQKTAPEKQGAYESASWVRLCEKGYAALSATGAQLTIENGMEIISLKTYESIGNGGQAAKALRQIAGPKYDQLKRYDLGLLEYASKDFSGKTRSPGEYSEDAFKLFSILHHARKQKAIITSSTPNERVANEKIGLVGNHAYSILKTFANQKTKDGRFLNLIVLRNPWGSLVPVYSQTRAGLFKLSKNKQSSTDGIFTLDLNDYLNLFSRLDIRYLDSK